MRQVFFHYESVNWFKVYVIYTWSGITINYTNLQNVLNTTLTTPEMTSATELKHLLKNAKNYASKPNIAMYSPTSQSMVGVG